MSLSVYASAMECPLLTYAKCYVMSGADLAYGATSPLPSAGLLLGHRRGTYAIALRTYYAVSGTDLLYGATREGKRPARRDASVVLYPLLSYGSATLLAFAPTDLLGGVLSWHT